MCVYVCMFNIIYMYIYVYIYICTHTHTHIHIYKINTYIHVSHTQLA
jgi:hypothetical protein